MRDSARRLLAEFVGTGSLVAVVIGSGIAAERLSPGDAGLRLLENSIATVFGLAVLILVFGPVSGAHFNPVVSVADWLTGRRHGTATAIDGYPALGGYIAAQILGAVAGAMLANAMFDLPAIGISTEHRVTVGHLLGEVVATAGLIVVIFALARSGRAALSAAAVAGRIGAAYWFTSSTSFANPAVTIGRVFSDTFAGIAPTSVPGFVAAQFVGAGIGLALTTLLYPATPVTTAAADTGDDVATADEPRVEPGPTSDPKAVSRMVSTPGVLFVCVHNAGRSQMAAAFLTHLAGDRIRVRSAGSMPADRINQVAVAAMAEIGIDITAELPKVLTPDVVRDSDVVITMGCGDACPYFPGTDYRDWKLDDPAGRDLAGVRPIRDEIRAVVEGLIAELLPVAPRDSPTGLSGRRART